MSSLHRGFGLIDVVVGTALLLLLFSALFGVLRASLMLSVLAKEKITAVELANTQMEHLRGTTYAALGTIGGVPVGTIPKTATSTIDGVPYLVRTHIAYYDDPADGTGAQDTNSITSDYKKGKVVVSYTLGGVVRSVTLISNFAPSKVETSP